VTHHESGEAGGGVDLAGENLSKLVELMARLRGPDGCPWDRAQDYDSVKGLLLEEAYEVADAVAARDFDSLEDELGDLLFQVVFYSRLAEEDARFTIDQVVERVYAKLIRRHPHVFGETRARTPEEALKSWNAVKQAERASQSKPPGRQGKSLLDGIAPSLPSTLEAYELGVRAAEAGFDWAKAEDLLDKIEEEVRELRRELKGEPEGASRTGPSSKPSGKSTERLTSSSSRPGGPNRIEEEVGDLLFASANLARFLRFDPESCLRRANRKFKRRFQALEDEIAKRGKRFEECSAEELDGLWNDVKAEE
jgi:nucleoside triphosphate diphosphatase